MRPFSFKEKETLSELFEELGYRKDLTPENNERYEIIDDTIIALTNKYPISIGLRLNIPFEVVSFQNSFFFQPRIIKEQTLEMINFLATNLSYVSEQLNLEHIFPLDQVKHEFLNTLNSFMPEHFAGEKERQWLTRIRVSYMNKYDTFKEIDNEFYQKLAKGLDSVGIRPTWELPTSLKAGIPKQKMGHCLIFSNDEHNEFLIVERGYISFLRDIEVNNIHLRTYFESYTPLLLYLVFNKVEGFSTVDLILSWIRFARMTLNPLLNILDSEYILSREFFQLNVDKFLQNTNLADTAVPIPLLARERIEKDELKIPKSTILRDPPKTFTELEAVQKFKAAQQLAQKSKIQRAIQVFNESLVLFNKFHQKMGVVKVLIQLSDIALNMKKIPQAIDYLKNSLDVCKSGQVPMALIVKTHEKLGKIYLETKEFDKAETHFKIIHKFLKAEDPKKFARAIQIVRLLLAKVYVETERYKEASLVFKDVSKHASDHPDILAKYYTERGRYYLKRGSVSNALQSLKKGSDIKEVDPYQRALILYEMSKIFLYERNSGSRAQAYLIAADKLLGEKILKHLFLKIKVYECLIDAFEKTKDREERNFYAERARQIRNVLHVRGLY